MEDVVSAWKGLEWDDLQIRIEEEIRVIGNRQDEGEEGRRLLLDESTKYRENTTKDTRKVAVPLIKAFQKEVDRLTSRGRATEAALIDICSRLTHIPDPSSLLEQALIWKAQAEKTNNAIEEANQLRSNIAELHAEFADLQNQDVTVRQLRERIRELEELKVQEVDQTVLDTEKRIREEVTEREAEMNMRSDKLKSENAALEKKVHELEIHLKDAQRRLDSAKIVADQRETLETEQIDILSKDLASANRRVASLELEVSRLTSDLADAHASSKRGGLEDIAALGGLMKEKDEQIGRLQAENRKLMDTLDAETKRHKSERDGLVRQLSEQQKLVAELKEVVNERTDYDSIKNELRLLREIEFGDAATANEVAINQLGSTVQALDRLLAEKNRRLQNENAQLRVTNQKQQEQFDAVSIQLTELQELYKEKEVLVNKLELDLSSIGSRKGAGNEHSTLEALESVLESSEPESSDSSVLSIVTAQRDRLRIRVTQLEDEVIVQKSQNQLLSNEVEKLKEDNVKLYGKIKYLQGSGNRSTSVAIDTSNNYSEQYEQRLNPFNNFSQSERLRSYTKLKLHDRASLSIGRAIMSSATARLTFFFYLLIMHVLVFVVLYRTAYAGACEQDFQKDCVEQFAQHMKQHHADH